MKNKITKQFCIIVFLCSHWFGWGQLDYKSPRSSSVKNPSDLNTSSNMPSLFDYNTTDTPPSLELSKKDDKDFNMYLPENQPKSYVVDEAKKKLDNIEGKNISLAPFRRNQHFGDTTIFGNNIVIMCRDHQAIDGDNISIKLNGEVLVPQISLIASYHSITISLKQGFNLIEFEALNMGKSPPNTAEFIIYDEDKKLLTQNKWTITTGYKASFIVVKN